MGNLLVWPVALVAVLIYFRRPLRDLLNRVQSYEGMGHKVIFANRVESAREAVDEAEDEALEGKPQEDQATTTRGPETAERGRPRTPRPQPQRPERIAVRTEGALRDLLRQAKRDPSGLVLGRWEQLSQEVTAFARDVEPDLSRRQHLSTGRALAALVKHGVIQPSYAQAFNELREARNQVAHAQFIPDSESAYEFAITAGRMHNDLRLGMAEWVPSPEAVSTH